MSVRNAHGTLLKMGDALVSPTYATIAQVVSYDGPSMSRGTTPVPTHDDTGGVPHLADALYDGGEVTLSLRYDPTLGTHDAATGFLSVFQSGEERPFQLIFPTAVGVQLDFNGFITNCQPTGLEANTGVMMANVTVKVNGTVTEV